MPAKKIIQDIVPSSKRTIRNIPLDDREYVEEPRKEIQVVKKGIEIKKIVEDRPLEEEPIIVPKNVRQPGPKKKRSTGKYVLSFLIVFICIGLIALALSLSYSKAIVTITPKVSKFDINGTFTAKKDATLGDLSYEVITVNEEEMNAIPATKGAAVETKSKGTLTIYNNYSAGAQTLVAGTRLAASDGLIYRTTTTVNIPGKKTSPGALDIEVVADQAGEKYNSAVGSTKGDLKVVAYKGTDKYDGFYAKLKTDLSGGYSGNKMILDEAAKTQSIKTMEDSIKAKLTSKIKTTLPENYILYDSAYNIEYVIPEPVLKDGGQAELTVRGIAYVPIFKIDSLIKYIAGSEIKKFPSDTYRIEGEENLDFKVSNTKDFSPKKGTSLIFSLKGPISIIGTFDENKLKQELKGVSLADSNAIFARYTSISNAYALITPFWMRSFPGSIDKINIEYKQ